MLVTQQGGSELRPSPMQVATPLCCQTLITVAPLHTVTMAEFADYLKPRRQTAAGRQPIAPDTTLLGVVSSITHNRLCYSQQTLWPCVALYSVTRAARIAKASFSAQAAGQEADIVRDTSMEQEAGYSDNEDHVSEPFFDDIFEAGPSNACEDLVNPAMPLQVRKLGDSITYYRMGLSMDLMHVRCMSLLVQEIFEQHAWSREAGGDLEERVKQWQQSIQPHLDAHKNRPTFDIKVYGQRIIDTVSQVSRLRAHTACYILL